MHKLCGLLVLAAASLSAGASGAHSLSGVSASDAGGPIVLVRGMSMAPGGMSMARGGMSSMATGGTSSMATGNTSSMTTGGTSSMAMGGMSSMAPGGTSTAYHPCVTAPSRGSLHLQSSSLRARTSCTNSKGR
jgi:hypothetical protein